MRKLLSRCSSGPSLILCASSSSPPSSVPLFLSLSYPQPKPKPHFPSLGFCVKQHSVRDPMPSSTAINLQPCIGVLPNSSNSSKPCFSCRVSPTTTGGSAICRCSIEDATTLQRAWTVFKEIRSGSRLAWFHTAAGDGSVSPAKGLEEDDSDDDDDGYERETGVNESEEVGKPSVKLQRRARSAGGASVNPDLLTIPGVVMYIYPPRITRVL